MEIETDAGKNIRSDWGFVAHFHRTASEAAAADTTSVLALTALTAAAQTINTGITKPAVPRNVQIVGNAAGIAGDVVVKGTAYDGSDISETLTLNGTGAVEGAKAFFSITEIDLPAFTNANTDEVSVGLGNKLGVPFKLALDTVLSAHLGGVKEGALPTVVSDNTNIENNTVTLGSALNGTEVDVFLIV